MALALLVRDDEQDVRSPLPAVSGPFVTGPFPRGHRTTIGSAPRRNGREDCVAPRYHAAMSSGGTQLVVEEVGASSVTDATAALEALVPQLSSSAPAPTADEVRAIVESAATVLFVARLGPGGPIVGSLTLAIFRIPTGLRAWIEDVVVDTSRRGLGIGSALVGAALARAGEEGCRNVDLTSRPGREDANRLYQRLGFSRRDTNVYRMDLQGERA